MISGTQMVVMLTYMGWRRGLHQMLKASFPALSGGSAYDRQAGPCGCRGHHAAGSAAYMYASVCVDEWACS